MYMLKTIPRALKLNTARKLSSAREIPIIYGFSTSQPARSVLLFCSHAGIEYKYEEINVFKWKHLSPEYLSINPAAKVPALKEGDFTLGESGAILQYLAESRNLQEFYPSDPLKRGKISFWMHWHHTNARLSTTAVLHPRLFGVPDVEKIFAEGVDRFNIVMKFLDAQLESSKYLVGDRLTIADFLLVPELDQLGKTGYDLIDMTPYKNVDRYLCDFKSNVKGYEENIAPVTKVAAKIYAKLHPAK